MGPAPLEGSCERGKVSAHWEVASLVGRSARTEGEFWSFGGGCSNQFAEGKGERDLQRRSVPPPGTPPGLRCLLIYWGGWGLGVEARAVEVRPGERTGVGCVETAWGAWGVGCPNQGSTGGSLGPPEKQGEEGVQGEGWDHHIRVSFSVCVCTLRQEGTAYTSSGGECKMPLPSQTPKVGADCCHCQGSWE